MKAQLNLWLSLVDHSSLLLYCKNAIQGLNLTKCELSLLSLVSTRSLKDVSSSYHEGMHAIYTLALFTKYLSLILRTYTKVISYFDDFGIRANQSRCKFGKFLSPSFFTMAYSHV